MFIKTTEGTLINLHLLVDVTYHVSDETADKEESEKRYVICYKYTNGNEHHEGSYTLEDVVIEVESIKEKLKEY